MSIREKFFKAFDHLIAQGVKIRDINITQIRDRIKEHPVPPGLFYQYRYLYKKERELK